MNDLGVALAIVGGLLGMAAGGPALAMVGAILGVLLGGQRAPRSRQRRLLAGVFALLAEHRTPRRARCRK